MSSTHGAASIDFDQALRRAIARRSLHGLKRLLKGAQERVLSAQEMGWKGLEASWKRSEREVLREIEELQAAKEAT